MLFDMLELWITEGDNVDMDVIKKNVNRIHPGLLTQNWLRRFLSASSTFSPFVTLSRAVEKHAASIAALYIITAPLDGMFGRGVLLQRTGR